MDCIFILLIFFIVTTTFVEETGIEVDKPQAASSVRLEKTSILIALTAKGEVDIIVTELAFIRVTKKGLVLEEIAEDTTVEEVIKNTEAKLTLAGEIRKF
jgi:acyl CoA:acetate/3-ketoacid CoA transferase beta subunit